MRYTLTRAAELAEASYTGKSHPVISFQWKASLDKDDVQAHLLTDNTLLIVGSNSINDYIRYNLRIQRLGEKRLSLKTVPGVTWHQGFLAHARIVHDWLVEHKYTPSFIIGHSLGAASAQVLSAAYGVPAIGFAAPRPCRTASARSAAARCLLVNRTDDWVCNLAGGFMHLGNVCPVTPRVDNSGLDHSMLHYRQAVSEGIASRSLPQVWPA